MKTYIQHGRVMTDSEVEKILSNGLIITDMENVAKECIVYLESIGRKYIYTKLPLGLHKLEIKKVG